LKDKKLLLDLYAHPDFGPYIKKIAEQRPRIPIWRAELGEKDWIYQSGMQQGFDLVISFFEGVDND
jgi:hypothetical protein